MSTDASGSTFTDTQTCGSIRKDGRGITCTDDIRSACTDISNDSTGVRRITCLYIPTKGTVMHIVTSTDNSTVNTVVCGRTNAYDEYVRYKPIRYIGTDIVGKVRKEIRYDDALK